MSDLSLSEPPGVVPGHTLRDPATWGLIRRDYLAGGSAAAVAERYGVSESALRTRARQEGWRKTDQADPDWTAAADDEPAFDPDAPPPSAAEIAAHARFEAARAVRLRRPAEAERWTRVHERWSALARAEAAAPAAEARAADRRRQAEESAALAELTREARRLEMQNRARTAEIGLELKTRIATAAAQSVQPLQPLQPSSGDDSPLADLERRIADRKRRGLPAGQLIRDRDALRRAAADPPPA